MKKKILIGSMLVLTLLLLMPSIPAVQQKTIEEGIKQNLQEKLDDNDSNDIIEINELEDDIKFPNLFNFIYGICVFRFTRGMFLFIFGSANNSANMSFPLVSWRGLWLVVSTDLLIDFWMNISDQFGWGWDFTDISN